MNFSPLFLQKKESNPNDSIPKKISFQKSISQLNDIGLLMAA